MFWSISTQGAVAVVGFDERLTRFLPNFDYHLINLTRDPDNKFSLLTSAYAQLTAGLMKTIRQKQQLRQMLADLSLVLNKLVLDMLGEQFVKTALLYVGYGSGLTKIEVLAIFKNISPKTEDVIMSAFEELEVEYMEKGKQQTTLQHIKGMLKLGMTPNFIAAAFDLPLETVNEYIKMIKESQA